MTIKNNNKNVSIKFYIIKLLKFYYENEIVTSLTIFEFT